jgi:hypothetical protein
LNRIKYKFCQQRWNLSGAIKLHRYANAMGLFVFFVVIKQSDVCASAIPSIGDSK